MTGTTFHRCQASRLSRVQRSIADLFFCGCRFCLLSLGCGSFRGLGGFDDHRLFRLFSGLILRLVGTGSQCGSTQHCCHTRQELKTDFSLHHFPPFGLILFAQIMWIVMTVETVRKLAHHGIRMRDTMAFLTFRHITMFVMMAEYTFEGCMLGGTGSQEAGDITMAGTTVLVGNFLVVGDIQGLMNPVTGDAVGKLLSLPVGLMTFHAVRDITVLVMMADGTVKGTMGTGIVFHLRDLGLVTGITDSDIIFAKGDMQGLMRIGMTAETVIDFKMSLALVAHGTLGNHRAFLDTGGMVCVVAVQTTDFRSMLAAIIHILMNNGTVTFYTVAVCQYRILRPCTLCSCHEPDSQKHDCHKNVLSHDSSP